MEVFEVFDYEFIPIEDIEIPVVWDFDSEDDVDFEALEEMEATLSVASLFEEELGYGV